MVVGPPEGEPRLRAGSGRDARRAAQRHGGGGRWLLVLAGRLVVQSRPQLLERAQLDLSHPLARQREANGNLLERHSALFRRLERARLVHYGQMNFGRFGTAVIPTLGGQVEAAYRVGAGAGTLPASTTRDFEEVDA